MKEAQYILQSVTPRSLVVLDELCRHTTVEEGSAIAWSICEKLLLTSAFTFAATHFLHLTVLSNMYHNVTTCVVQRFYVQINKPPKNACAYRCTFASNASTASYFSVSEENTFFLDA